MNKPFPVIPLLVSVLAFAVCVYTFGSVNPYVFTPSAEATHIIDSHLQECHRCFFDSGYVQLAAQQYIPAHYLHAYYILDFIFPFVYSTLYLLLASGLRGRKSYRLFLATVIIGGAFDLLENTSFVFYLYHRLDWLSVQVAIFTTLKSVLFLANAIFALVAFIGWGPFRRRA